MKIKFLLLAVLILFCLNNVNAQSHISTGKYACQLVPKSRGYEKYTCPACAANDVKVAQAKAAEDKRRTDAAIAKANADKAARDLAYKKTQKEREEKNKVTEVSLAMPSDASLPNSNSNTENTNSNSISETPVYTPTYTKQDVTNQMINQAATLAGGLINDWNANYEKRMEKRKAEESAAFEAAYEKKTEKFKAVYLPLMDLAKKGDENAKMILYFASKELRREYLVPQRDQWYQKALANNNTDAQLLKAFNLILSYKKGDESPVPYVEKIAEKGSVDAMVMLGDWYDISDKSRFEFGGNDPKKAMEWYEKAAAKGSPNAMYYLGMIYKYGRTYNYSGPIKKWHVKYDVVPDEKIAFDWFTKSLQPDVVQSIFSNGTSYERFSSGFNHETYPELAYFYRKGKIVPKDKAKADALEFKVLFAYKNKQKYEYVD
ncbi:hypothetical protein AAGV28_08040 [Flavobacterium sp. FZUC8N2.13]|uniref:Sel1 repeat family protein n=1 Tax=Flavobacterium zubiriense TaxID=3138075 RepID=A0ABV4TD60_9FLAO